MHAYISNLIKMAKDNSYFFSSTKTYFPPWWKFWDRKVRTEVTLDGSLKRHFNCSGNLVRIDRRCSVLSSAGIGSRYYWETLDLKTMTATSSPYPGITKKIFPNGKGEEIHAPQDNNIQEIILGSVDMGGDITPYARLFLKDGKRIGLKWVKKVRNEEFWRHVVQSYPLTLDEKASLLEKASRDFQEGKELPKTEAELHAFKASEEKNRLHAHKESYRKTVNQEKTREWSRRYAARRGANK